MGPILCFLSAALQAVAAGLALRLGRTIGYRWAWMLLSLAMGLQAVRRVSVGVELLHTGAALPPSELIGLAISTLFLVGVLALQGFFRESQEGIDSRRRAAAEGAADRKASERLEQVVGAAPLLEMVVETADAWIAVTDEQGRAVLWNQAAERISGYLRDEVLGRGEAWEWLYPEPAYRSEILRTVGALLRGGPGSGGLETRIRCRSGETRVVSWRTSPLRDPQDRLHGLLFVGQDVTALRQAEARFQRVSAIQSLLLEHNVLGVAYIQERRIIWGNPRGAELFGLPPERFIGASARSIYPDDATYEAFGRQAYATMARGEVFDQRMQARRANGRFFWCRLIAMAVDPARPHAGSVWLAEDISEQVAAEAALQESEARFRGAFEGTHDALLLLTPDGIFDCNQRALGLFGFAHKAELLRLQTADLSPARQRTGEDSRTLATRHLHEAFQNGSSRFLWDFRRQTGEIVSTDVLLSSFRMGRRKVVQASIRDEGIHRGEPAAPLPGQDPPGFDSIPG